MSGVRVDTVRCQSTLVMKVGRICIFTGCRRSLHTVLEILLGCRISLVEKLLLMLLCSIVLDNFGVLAYNLVYISAFGLWTCATHASSLLLIIAVYFW